MLRVGRQHLHPKASGLRWPYPCGRSNQRLLVRYRAIAGSARMSMDHAVNVLVIDDSEDDRELYRRVLKAAFGGRLNFLEETNGSSGLNAIEKVKPNCVLLDYSLPGQNGIEVLKRIRNTHPHLPIILLTGQGNEAIAAQSIKEGAQDYITKGEITAEALSRAIRTAIENGAQQKRINEQHLALE